MQRSRIASLDAAAFLNWEAEIFETLRGSCTTTRTSDLYRPKPAIAPTTPSLPTVAVSMALPSSIPQEGKSSRSGESIHDQILPPPRSVRCLGRTTPWSNEALEDRTAYAAGMTKAYCPTEGPNFWKALRYPARSVGPIPQGGWNTLREHVPRGEVRHIGMKMELCRPGNRHWTSKSKTSAINPAG